MDLVAFSNYTLFHIMSGRSRCYEPSEPLGGVAATCGEHSMAFHIHCTGLAGMARNFCLSQT